MASVEKCDNCGALDTASNPVRRKMTWTTVDAIGVRISVEIPDKWQHSDLCADCVADIIRARFVEICGLLAPYQPPRVAGFVQAGLATNDGLPTLTKQERQALSLLSKRLLKA